MCNRCGECLAGNGLITSNELKWSRLTERMNWQTKRNRNELGVCDVFVTLHCGDIFDIVFSVLNRPHWYGGFVSRDLRDRSQDSQIQNQNKKEEILNTSWGHSHAHYANVFRDKWLRLGMFDSTIVCLFYGSDVVWPKSINNSPGDKKGRSTKWTREKNQQQ